MRRDVHLLKSSHSHTRSNRHSAVVTRIQVHTLTHVCAHKHTPICTLIRSQLSELQQQWDTQKERQPSPQVTRVQQQQQQQQQQQSVQAQLQHPLPSAEPSSPSSPGLSPPQASWNVMLVPDLCTCKSPKARIGQSQLQAVWYTL